jgi:hypothetical protein
MVVAVQPEKASARFESAAAQPRDHRAAFLIPIIGTDPGRH